jgi:hypothetical protein
VFVKIIEQTTVNDEKFTKCMELLVLGWEGVFCTKIYGVNCNGKTLFSKKKINKIAIQIK